MLENVDNENFASTHRIEKPKLGSPRGSIEKLQPTVGNPFAARSIPISYIATTRNFSVTNQ